MDSNAAKLLRRMTHSLSLPAISTLFLLPVMIWVANVLVRQSLFNRVPASSGADWLLLLIVLDATGVLVPREVENLIHHSAIKKDAGTVFFWMLAISGISWFMTVAKIEPALEVALSAKRKPHAVRTLLKRDWNRIKKVPFFWVAITTVILAFLTGLHALIFLY